MAHHKQCPRHHPHSDETIIGTALMAVRCKMINENRCKGNGETRGSLSPYCIGCSEYYGLCEQCGEPFTPDHPKNTFPLIVIERVEEGYIATSPLFPEFITSGTTLEQLVAMCSDALTALPEIYQKDKQAFPNVPL